MTFDHPRASADQFTGAVFGVVQKQISDQCVTDPDGCYSDRSRCKQQDDQAQAGRQPVNGYHCQRNDRREHTGQLQKGYERADRNGRVGILMESAEQIADTRFFLIQKLQKDTGKPDPEHVGTDADYIKDHGRKNE